MKRLSCLLLMAACAYDPPTEPRGNDGNPTGPGSPKSGCNSELDPVLCLEFETGMPALAIDTSRQPLSVVASSIDETVRDAPAALNDAKAAEFDGFSSKLTVAGLQLAGDVTVEMWHKTPRSIGGIVPRRWLFDGGRRFFMSHGDDGEIRCGINFTGIDDGDLRVDSDIEIDDGRWHHIACSFDNATREAKVYIDGDLVGCEVFDAQMSTVLPAAPATIGALPTLPVIGDTAFIGALDSIHVYTHVLDATDICTSAGGNDCRSTCPPRNGGGQNGGGGGGPGGP